MGSPGRLKLLSKENWKFDRFGPSHENVKGPILKGLCSILPAPFYWLTVKRIHAQRPLMARNTYFLISVHVMCMFCAQFY